MDVLTSSEFRKHYARLNNPTAVTANGHIIGRWIPAPVHLVAGDSMTVTDGETWPGITASGKVERTVSRPFRPVPKPSQKGK